MIKRFIVIGFGTVAALAVPISAQAPSPKIDFKRDVQPILRQYCISCHGAAQAQGNLRLDRRRDALRGGNISDIAPGNSAGSRMYLKLVGMRYGLQMPPTEALAPEQIDIIKTWIDQGAEWPIDASGEAPVVPPDPGAIRLMAALRAGDATMFSKLLETEPKAVAARGTDGDTPLMYAAFYGTSQTVKQLLDRGADATTKNDAGATALMWAIGDAVKAKLLLDAHADPNVRSDDGRTALVLAAGRPGSAAVVKELLDHGATTGPAMMGDLTPLREAARVGDVAVFKLLLDRGADPMGLGAPPVAFVRTNCPQCADLLPPAPPAAPAATAAPAAPPRAAAPALPPAATAPKSVSSPIAIQPGAASIGETVRRSIPLLQRNDMAFTRKTGCVSCHHNSVAAMAVAAARDNGYEVDRTMAAQQERTTALYLDSWRQRGLQGIGIAGGQDSASYVVFGLIVQQHAADAVTDAQAYFLKTRQLPDGHWRVGARRPPIESSDLEVTALCMRVLQIYAPPALAAEYRTAVERARDWLISAEPQNTEDRAFQLLGLAWAGVKGEPLDRAVRALVSEQRADGGWAQLSTLSSDAYATGQVLVALEESGIVKSTDPTLQKGVGFLVSTQETDGSWHVTSRSNPVQPLFESGFPHGRDQWISSAATGWATTALARFK